jgi:hypothetical protein
MVIFAALSVSSHLLAAAHEPPTFNVEPSCGAAGQVAIAPGRDKEACLRDERAARDQLAKNWDGYPAGDREKCTSLSTMGGPPSYVELISCLELMHDARTSGATTTGQNPSRIERGR